MGKHFKCRVYIDERLSFGVERLKRPTCSWYSSFCKTLEITRFGICCVCNGVVIKCFENNIKCLLNVAKRIPINGIGQCGTETHDIHWKF